MPLRSTQQVELVPASDGKNKKDKPNAPLIYKRRKTHPFLHLSLTLTSRFLLSRLSSYFDSQLRGCMSFGGDD